MATAIPIDTVIGIQPSDDAKLYRLDPPVGETTHVIVWTESAQAHLPARAVAVSADEHGSVKGLSLKPVAEYSHPWTPTHSGLLWLMGTYEIGAPETPAPEAEPEEAP